MAKAKKQTGVAPVKETTPAKAPERNEFRRFLMLNQATAEQVASGILHLTNTELRAWMALISHADSWNYIRQRQSWLADSYGIARPAFSVALRGLIDKDMVIRTRDTGSGSQLMLSPFHFWKGLASEHGRGMAVWRRLAKVAKENRKSGSE